MIKINKKVIIALAAIFCLAASTNPSRFRMDSLVLIPSASAPSNPVSGELYFDSDDGAYYRYTGSAWEVMSTAASKGPVSVALTGDVNLSTLSSFVESGTNAGRKIVYTVTTADEWTVTVDDTGSDDDVWRFRTDNASARINLLEDSGVTISFVGKNGEDGAKIEGFDQYALLRKSATNNFTSSGTVTGYNASSTVVSIVSESLHDAEETISTGSVAGGSSGLDIENDNIVGVFFSGGDLSIPSGATITNAYITFEAQITRSNTVNAIIEAEDADAVIFAASTNNLSNRTMTTSDVTWNAIENWTDGTTYDTPDLSAIVQEWVDRGAYASDDNIVFLITYQSGGGSREAVSFNGTGVTLPTLTITYTN